MIINKKTKQVVEMDSKPNENWTGDNERYYVVDSNSEFAKKIRENAPFIDFVTDEAGNLIDVTLTEKPVVEYEPTTEDMLLEMDYRLTCVELGL